jgi:3D (Asp-Asp-Asp) domain-containing protein
MKRKVIRIVSLMALGLLTVPTTTLADDAKMVAGLKKATYSRNIRQNKKESQPMPKTEVNTSRRKPEEPKTNPAVTYKITAYTASSPDCGKTDGITASGVKAKAGITVAASKDLPFGTVLYIDGIGYRTVQDRGGAIGPGHLDLYVDSESSAIKFGVQYLKVTVVKLGSGTP